MNKNATPRKTSVRHVPRGKEDKTYVVRHESELLTFLMSKMPSQSQKNVRRIIANHQVAVGGVPISLFAYKLYPEDEVTVSWNRIQKRTSGKLPIIYEDEDIIALDKPSGLLSIASDKEKSKTAYRLVSDYLAAFNRNSRAFVVHRLDEDTSGVLIFAKSHELRERLQRDWSTIVRKRGYYAIVEGEDIADEAVLKDYLIQDRNNLMYVTKDRRNGKLCVTHFKKISAKEGYSLLDVDISTGRKNQIRVQLGHLGHHVIGDDKYGEPKNPIKRLGLHAYELSFVNPVNGREYDLKSAMPSSFKKMFFDTGKKPEANAEVKNLEDKVKSRVWKRKRTKH